MKSIYLILLFGTLAISASAQQADPPMTHTKMDHDKVLHQNGEKAMGFSQSATTHHFLIKEDGGAIQVEVNDPKNTDDREKIRMHLAMIAKQFKQGVFSTSFAVHGEVPPGAKEMEKLKANIKYTYEETDAGGRVRMISSNTEAINAIHAFLKYQINEHKTGDPLK